MRVAVAGGHGQIALLLHALLVAQGDRAVAIVRNPDHADDVRAAGAEPVVCDLETAAAGEVAAAIRGCDAVVFAAGAGPGSGAERKTTMDLGGALKTIAAARAEGVRRYVMISAMGAADPPAGDEVFSVYLRAKAQADDALRASGLDATVVRPGGLIDAPPTGRVSIAARLAPGTVPRADVAAVVAAVLPADGTVGATFDLVSGETPVGAAVAAVAA